MEIQQITDYSFNLELLLEQYKNKENLKGMIDSSNDQADDIEQALFEIRDLYFIDDAEGVQLDSIGAIWNVVRNGDTDVVYRENIKIQAALRSSGNPEEIMAILIVLFGATFITFVPGYPSEPASYTLITDATLTAPELEAISVGGVDVAFGGFLLLESGDFLLQEDGVSKIIIT